MIVSSTKIIYGKRAKGRAYGRTHHLPAIQVRTGRPSKRTATNKKAILRLVTLGMPFSQIYAAVKISKNTFADWRREPEFARELEEALAKGTEKRLRTIEAANNRDWRSAAWLLEHCQPELFAKSRLQIEVAGQFEHSFVIPQETLDRIAEARKLADAHEPKQIINAGA